MMKTRRYLQPLAFLLCLLVAVVAAGSPTRAAPDALTWQIRTLDSGGDVGRAVSLAVVNGRPAVVERRADGYWLADLGSANGTFVNGQRLNGPHRLADGDLIGLGGPEPLLRFLDEALTVRRGEPAPFGPRLQFDPAGLSFTVDGRPRHSAYASPEAVWL